MDGYREKARQLAGRSLVVGFSALSTAGSKVARAAAAGVGALTATDKEKITALKFAHLDAAGQCPVLLLAYETGFQVWGLDGPGEPAELLSKRDGPVRLIDLLPAPAPNPARGATCAHGALAGTHPLLVLARGGPPTDPEGAPAELSIYSIRTHAVVETLALTAPALALATSPSLLVVSLPGQLAAYDARTLEQRFTCLVYSPGARAPSLPDDGRAQMAPCALGDAWLAYPSPQAVPKVLGGVAKPRGPSKGARGSSDAQEAVLSASAPATPRAGPGSTASRARDLVQRGGASLASAGSYGLQYLSDQMSAWRGRGAAGAGGPGISGAAGEVAGTVLVRDVSTRRVIALWRAHSSALAALAFDASGVVLATASVGGRSVRVWRLCPRLAQAEGDGAAAATASARVDCLAVLHRGVTPAVIQALRFSCDGAWLAAVSGRGTAHVFCVRGGAAAGAPPPVATAEDEGAAAGGLAATDAGGPAAIRAYGRARRPGLLRGGGVVAAASGAKRALRRGDGPAHGDATGAPRPGRGAGPHGDGGDGVLPCAVVWCSSQAAPSGQPAPPATLLAAAADGLFMAFDVASGRSNAQLDVDDEDEDDASASAPSGRREALAAPPAAPPSPTVTLQDSARWEVGRRYGWHEREEELSSLPGSPATVEVVGSDESERLAVAEQQRWLVESQSVWDYWHEAPLACHSNVTFVPDAAVA